MQVRSVEDFLAIGQVVQVLCLGRDNRGFVKISMKALEPPLPQTPPPGFAKPQNLPTPPIATRGPRGHVGPVEESRRAHERSQYDDKVRGGLGVDGVRNSSR